MSWHSDMYSALFLRFFWFSQWAALLRAESRVSQSSRAEPCVPQSLERSLAAHHRFDTKQHSHNYIHT